MTTVSVIIPTYNRASLLKEAIESVLDQTLSDFEIIVVDDGSTDETHDVVSAFSDTRIRYVFQPNRGRSSARNHGISLARGRYVAFLDSDDMFLPAKLESQVSCMEKNPDVLLSHTSYVRITAEGRSIKEVRSGAFSGNVYPGIMRRCPIATPTVMVRREALSEQTEFDGTLHIGEDVILWIQLTRRSRLMGIDQVLSKVRIQGNNVALDSQAQITHLMNIVECTIKSDPDLSFVTRRSLLSSIYLYIAWHYLHTAAKPRSLRFIVLSFLNQPLNPPLVVTSKIAALLRSNAIAQCRRIRGRLRGDERRQTGQDGQVKPH